MVQWRRLLSDEYLQVGIRTGLGIFIVTALGWTVVYPAVDEQLRESVSRAVTAAAITCVLVQAPVIGRIGQVSFDRTVGTILGGACGFLAYSLVCKVLHDRDAGSECLDEPRKMGLLLSVLSAVAAVVSIWLAGALFGLEITPRLFMLTFLLVCFSGAHSIEASKMVLLSRVVGIIAGVAVSVILAVFVYPKSANEECLTHIRRSLVSLDRLCDGAWQHGLFAMTHRSEDSRSDTSSGERRFNKLCGGRHDVRFHAIATCNDSNPCRLPVDFFCEEALTDILNELDEVKELLPLTRAEIFVGVFRHKMYFLPASTYLPVRGRWILPPNTVMRVEMSIRWVARLLWTLHLAFGEGFSLAYTQYLNSAYPSHLLPELYESCKATIKDLSTAFPPFEPTREDLDKFASSVNGLIQISDYHRRSIVQVLKLARKQMHQRQSCSNWAGYHHKPARGYRPPQAPSQPVESASEPQDTASAGQGQEEERPFFVRATRDTTESITMGGQAVEHHVRISGQEHFYDAKLSTAASLEGADSGQGEQPGKGSQQQPTPGRGHPPAPSLNSSPGTSMYSMPCLQLAMEEPGKCSGSSSSLQGRDISDSSRQSHDVECGVMYEHELPATDNLAQSLGAELAQGAAQDLLSTQLQEPTLDDQSLLEIPISKREEATSGEPSLSPPTPDKQAEQQTASRSQQPAASEVSGCTTELNVGANTFNVEDILKEEQLLFPDTDDGQIALVRWCSFQFLAEELSEALDDLHGNLTELIRSLPSHDIVLDPT